MATKSVTARTDRIHELTYQAKSIVQTIRTAAEGGVQAPNEAYAGACMAVEGMLREIEQLTTEALP